MTPSRAEKLLNGVSAVLKNSRGVLGLSNSPALATHRGSAKMESMADPSHRRDDAHNELLALYLHLARASELRRRPLIRDRLLVIAAATASRDGLPRIAALCRSKILEHNPGHMFRRWHSVEAAMNDDEFEPYLKQLERRFPPEKAEQMLQSLEVDIAGERDVYYSDEEYAASIWGLSLEELAAAFPDSDGEKSGEDRS